MVATDVEVPDPTSWGELVDAAERRGELAKSPVTTLPWDEPAESPLSVEIDTPPADVPASPVSAGSFDSLRTELAEASAAADALLAARNDVSYTPTVSPEKAHVLDLLRPHWLQGEDSITHAVHALAFDHGMDYSPAELDRTIVVPYELYELYD